MNHSNCFESQTSDCVLSFLNALRKKDFPLKMITGLLLKTSKLLLVLAVKDLD